MTVKAKDKLNTSKLNDQKELLQDDIEIQSLKLFIRGKQSGDVGPMIVSGSVERTIEGASTVTIECNDPDLELQNSGLITTETDINLDGLYFRIVSAERQGDSLTIVFEDREVAMLRLQKSFVKANRDSMTRAEFVHSLVKQQKQVKIRFFCPQEHQKQPVAPDPTDPSNDTNRGLGFAPGAPITVAGINATKDQLHNTEIVLGVGLNMVGTEGLITAVIVINTESRARNLPGGDRDSVGIFQQRNIAPWNLRNRRDVAQASKTFFEQLQKVIARDQARHEKMTPPILAQEVQLSAYPDRYKAYEPEAENTVNEYLGGGNNLQDTSQTGNNFLDSSAGGSVYEFSRGTMDQYGRVTRETTWDCAHRLADEVQWRCFMVSGTMYFIDDPYLFKSRPRMRFGPDYRDHGVDSLDFDYDRQKSNAKVTITCHISRWGAPPGSVVQLHDLGPISGRWLVQDIKRDLFSTDATIELIKPLPKLPEPPATGSATPDSLIVGPTSSMRQAIVQAAQRALANKSRYTYRQYRPMADSLFDAFAYAHTDCSAFATLCYKAGGAPDPNGFSYNGQGYTGTLWANGTFLGINPNDAQPADLAFFGLAAGHRSGGAITTHVGVYIGGGMMIDFGSTPIKQVPITVRNDFLGFRSYLDDGSSGR